LDPNGAVAAVSLHGVPQDFQCVAVVSASVHLVSGRGRTKVLGIVE
jgi:hypothetical protein